MQAFANSANPFADFIIGLFCKEVLLLDVVTNVAWKDGDKGGYLLVRILPRSEESFDDVSNLITQVLDDGQEEFHGSFKCCGQTIQDQIGRRNMLLKIWESKKRQG